MNESYHLSCKKSTLVKECVKIFKDNSTEQYKLKKFLKAIIENYYDFDNFHNFRHAFEVYQTTYNLINNVSYNFNKIEK